jgi:hypothetical protein
LSSVLREVGIASLPTEPSLSDWLLLYQIEYFENAPESQHRRSHPNGGRASLPDLLRRKPACAERAIAATTYSHSTIYILTCRAPRPDAAQRFHHLRIIMRHR